MPVQTRLLDHQVMTSLRKISPQVLDQHDAIDDHTRKYMEPMKTGDGKKEIAKVRGGLGPVRIQKRIPSPPGAFAMQMRPLPGLAAQEHQPPDNGQDHPF